jgi:hypothetical protein
VDAIKAWINRLTHPTHAQTPPDAAPSRDYAQERETARTGQMSAEDKAWEADTRQRDRAAHEHPQFEESESEGGAGATRTNAPRGEE